MSGVEVSKIWGGDSESFSIRGERFFELSAIKNLAETRAIGGRPKSKRSLKAWAEFWVVWGILKRGEDLLWMIPSEELCIKEAGWFISEKGIQNLAQARCLELEQCGEVAERRLGVLGVELPEGGSRVWRAEVALSWLGKLTGKGNL